MEIFIASSLISATKWYIWSVTILMPRSGIGNSFFVSGSGCEFSSGKAAHHEFPIREVSVHVPKDRDFTIILSYREEAHLHLLYAWVEQNDSATWSDLLLTHANINKFSVSPNQTHVFGC